MRVAYVVVSMGRMIVTSLPLRSRAGQPHVDIARREGGSLNLLDDQFEVETQRFETLEQRFARHPEIQKSSEKHIACGAREGVEMQEPLIRRLIGHVFLPYRASPHDSWCPEREICRRSRTAGPPRTMRAGDTITAD